MTVYPLILHLGPLMITGYGIMMMVAFLMAGWVMQRELARRGLKEDYAADIVVAAVIGGIVGGKIWYAALYHDWSTLVSRGGLVWYGGFLGGVLAVILNGARRRVPLRFTMELVAPALAVGYALGRVGCFLVQDDYGIPTSLPWGMRFPQGTPPSTVQNLIRDFGVKVPPGLQPTDVLAVHPTQLYEVALMLLAFWLIWRLRQHQHAAGWLFGLYLLLGGIERFLVEFLRAKDDRLLGPLTLAQGVSLAIAAVGLVMLARWARPDGSASLADVAALRPELKAQ
jgi:phosphatidylglycerol:prolipoprotein diacylglycerol transferase